MHFIRAYTALMNLEHIRMFVAVYRAGSFAGVAKDLDIAASSVSRAIAALEEDLKARLFQRTTRNLTPTQAGEQFYHRVEALIEEFDLAQQEIISQHQEPSGTLRITASVSFGQIIVAPLLKAFYHQYPKVRLEITLSDTRVNIISDQFDLAIRHGKLADSSLVARKLMSVNYALVASPEYLNSSAPLTKPDDIRRHNVIAFTYAEFNKTWRFKNPVADQTVAIAPILTLTSALAIKECVTNGMGVAMLPSWAIKEEIKSGSLVPVLAQWEVSGGSFGNGVWLIYPSRTFMPAKTKAFADFLIKHTNNE